jgi:hypothetical protein
VFQFAKTPQQQRFRPTHSLSACWKDSNQWRPVSYLINLFCLINY